MTIRKRLFWSNILMILVPVLAAGLVGLLCIGLMWVTLIGGASLGLHNREDFEHTCMAVAEIVEKQLDMGWSPDSLAGLLDSNAMRLVISREGEPYYAYGKAEEADGRLLAAAELLEQDGTVTHRGRSLFIKRELAQGQGYVVCLFGGSAGEKSYSELKLALAVCVLVIGVTIFLAVFLTNRFLTGFVFRKIREPLEILTTGVHALRDGNLDCRIAYDGQDEFRPVCEDFNEMAERLKDSVNRLRQQEQSRKELIAGISHDIRSPLTSIRAYAEGLLDGVAQTPRMQQKYLEIIKTKAEDLEHMVAQLFLFSKMELGEYPENPRPLRLDSLIRESVSAQEEEYRQKGLIVTMELEPVTVHADPVQLGRMTANLLENSLKYKNQPEVRVHITLTGGNGMCRLSFADDGPGVPEQALPHLFEAFYRSDPARQNPNQGSGLGLSIVANIVRRLGGRLTALPCTPTGLEIRIELPEEEETNG